MHITLNIPVSESCQRINPEFSSLMQTSHKTGSDLNHTFPIVKCKVNFT